LEEFRGIIMIGKPLSFKDFKVRNPKLFLGAQVKIP